MPSLSHSNIYAYRILNYKNEFDKFESFFMLTKIPTDHFSCLKSFMKNKQDLGFFVEAKTTVFLLLKKIVS